MQILAIETTPVEVSRLGIEETETPQRLAMGNALGEVERIRALLMNLHGILQHTNAAHVAKQPIESIHRALDLLAKDLAH